VQNLWIDVDIKEESNFLGQHCLNLTLTDLFRAGWCRLRSLSMVDHSKMKLGRKAIKTDSRTLAFAKYLTPALPAPPPAVDWTRGITSWGMMLNDTLGVCTIAGVGHAIQVWSANAGREVTVPDSTILSAYETWDGYDPKAPDSDQGGVLLDTLKDWKKDGFGGHTLLAFADPKPSKMVEIHQSIALFGGVYVGVSLPLTAQTQEVWDVVPDDGSGKSAVGSWGDHAIFIPKYDADGFTCITWGQPKKITKAFWKTYVDEAHVLFGQDWISAKGSPAGFDRDQLLADLKAIVH
jgi:hypothetical protein